MLRKGAKSTLANCSGLLGRTSLRLPEFGCCDFHAVPLLFRPSRPDFIETWVRHDCFVGDLRDCSGLLGRTSLRRLVVGLGQAEKHAEIVPAF